MKITSIAGILFLFVILVQLYVPMRQVIKSERVWRSGQTFKMQLAPVDPNDPFRGKYITLSFKENKTDVAKSTRWHTGDNVFVYLKPDEKNFLHIDHVAPYFSEAEKMITVKATVRHINEYKAYNELVVEYPFERYYVEESKAASSEKAYQEAARDSNAVAYGLLGVYRGDAVVKEIIIDGKSINK